MSDDNETLIREQADALRDHLLRSIPIEGTHPRSVFIACAEILGLAGSLEGLSLEEILQLTESHTKDGYERGNEVKLRQAHGSHANTPCDDPDCIYKKSPN